jgi:hypothetical protein
VHAWEQTNPTILQESAGTLWSVWSVWSLGLPPCAHLGTDQSDHTPRVRRDTMVSMVRMVDPLPPTQAATRELSCVARPMRVDLCSVFAWPAARLTQLCTGLRNCLANPSRAPTYTHTHTHTHTNRRSNSTDVGDHTCRSLYTQPLDSYTRVQRLPTYSLAARAAQ